MNSMIQMVGRAIERSTLPAVKIQRYERETHAPVRKADDTRLTPLERHVNATAILRHVERMPPYEQAVVLGLAGDQAMREGAVNILIDLVDRDYLGDGPAKEAIRWWMGSKVPSVRTLSKDYGGGKSMHHAYRHKVADVLDALLLRAESLHQMIY